MDDRNDFPKWLQVIANRAGASIDIEIADIRKGNVPVLEAREPIDWRKSYAQTARYHARQLRILEERLARVRAGRPHEVPWTEAKPPR
jgi:hypothetical protein